MIQPISTLRDHENVFQLPTPENLRRKNPSRIIEQDDPTTPVDIESARNNYRAAVESQKMTSLDDYLLSQPEKPELDEKMIGKNKKLSRNAALIQVLDGIADTVHLNRKQDEAMVAPSRYGQIGFAALDNLQNIDREFQGDLNRYTQRKEQVDQYNKGMKQQASRFNAGIDADLAKQDLQAEQAKYNQILAKEEREAIAADEKKEWHYQAGLRLITQRKFDEARAHFSEAGMKSETIENLVNEGGSSGSGGSTIAGVDLDPKSEALYEEYQYYNGQVEDDQYMLGEYKNPDYSKPKPGTPAWHRDKLIEKMGEDFYLIDYAKRPEREAMQRELAEQQRRKESEASVIEDPNTQKNLQRANNFFLQSAADESLPEQARQQAKAQWMENNRRVLMSDPEVPAEEVDALNEELFEYAVNQMQQRSVPQEIDVQGQFTDSPADKTDNTGDPDFAGMGNNKKQRRN